MGTKIQLSRVTLKTLLILLLVTTTSITAQSHKVKPLTNFIETYKEKHNVISSEIEARTDINFSEKIAIHNNEINKLKEDFRVSRKAEYLSKSAKRAKRHSSSRGSTDCGYAYVKAPNSNMYTIEEWIKTEGDIKDIKIAEDNSSVGIQLTTTGKGTTKATIYATFKYKPELIDTVIEFETNDLFSQIIKKTEEAIGSSE